MKRAAVLLILGSRCVHCGFSDGRALQVDHINGDGAKEYKNTFGAAYWNKVLKSVADAEKKYQLLCANCNWIKRCENKESTGRPRKV